MPSAPKRVRTARTTDPHPALTNGRDLTKGQDTRRRIVARARDLASKQGLAALTLGELAADLGLSKSGLFAHFRSKERLQLDVLEAAAVEFGQHVFVPAFALPRGEPRLRAIFDNWLGWLRSNRGGGGCIFLSGASEWDDVEGPVRDALVNWFEELHSALCRATRLALEAKHFDAALDVDQFAADFHGILLKYHLDHRLLRSPRAERHARTSLDALLQRARPRIPSTR